MMLNFALKKYVCVRNQQWCISLLSQPTFRILLLDNICVFQSDKNHHKTRKKWKGRKRELRIEKYKRDQVHFTLFTLQYFLKVVWHSIDSVGYPIPLAHQLIITHSLWLWLSVCILCVSRHMAILNIDTLLNKRNIFKRVLVMVFF